MPFPECFAKCGKWQGGVLDIARPASVAQSKRKRRILIGIGGVILVVLVTIGLSRLEPAAPTVEKGTVWVDTVKRGPMLRQVRGTGTLVPEDIRWIPATTDGRIERIVVLPGKVVQPDTILLELSNPSSGGTEEGVMRFSWCCVGVE